MGNSTPSLNINNIIESLRHAKAGDDTNVSFPDGLLNLSHLVTPLRIATIDGRAFDSDNEFAVANFLGNLVGAFVPQSPTEADLTNCILGLSVFIAMILRTIPENYPDTTMEEFLIDAANQDRIIALARTFASTPYTLDSAGQPQVDITQFPVLHAPVPITDAAIQGFIQRRIIGPLESASDDDLYEADDERDEEARPNIHIELSDIDPSTLIADPLNGFDEMHHAHFLSEHPDLDNDDDYEDPF